MLQAKACTCTFPDLCMPLQASANVLAIAENFYYLTKTSHIMQAARATSENLDKAKVAVHDIASSRNAHEASSRMWTLWRHAERGTFMTALGRMLVRMYTMISPLLLLQCSTHQLSPDQWSLNDWQALEHNSISAPARHVSRSLCQGVQPDQLLTAFQRDSFHEQVCLYFVNLVLEDYENYNFWHTPDMLERRNMYPHRFSPIRETFHVPVPRPAHAYSVSVVRDICLEGSVTDQIRSKCSQPYYSVRARPAL